MLEIFGKRFFEALREVAELQLGADHPCVQAIDGAAQSGTESDVAAAQKQLAALPDDVSGSLMEAVHKVMREDPAALLDAWDGPGGRRGTN
ncbi:MAG: hypothetical protein ACR2O4_06360 [Hyphomicrobiaceae bacterium]